MTRNVLLVGAAALALSATTANASVVLYDNGPINGAIDAFTINYGYAVSDSFTLDSAAILNGVTFGVWSYPGDQMTSVDWGIATQPGLYSVAGTATVANGAASTNAFGYNLSVDSFSLPNVALAAGTYYLVLQNAVVSTGNPVFWDENNGPSSASDSAIGSLANFDVYGTTGSETFQLLGAADIVEPGAWALMLIGLGGVGAVLRSRRRASIARG